MTAHHSSTHSQARSDSANADRKTLNVALFVTCLIDFLRPSVAFAAIRLLEKANCTVTVPAAQTCCGQPAFNSGDKHAAARIAQQVIRSFAPFDYVVVPSASCAGMLREDYPRLFSGDPKWHPQAIRLAEQVYELTDFLTNVLGDRVIINANCAAIATYHDSCASLRQCGIHAQPRQLLAQVSDLSLKEMPESEVCCGFGGVFCVKYPAISTRLVDNKLHAIAATGADTLLGADLGCLLHIEGRLRRQASAMHVLHIAEVLAGCGEAI